MNIKNELFQQRFWYYISQILSNRRNLHFIFFSLINKGNETQRGLKIHPVSPITDTVASRTQSDESLEPPVAKEDAQASF